MTTERVSVEDLRVGDVLANPHLGSMPPAEVTEVIVTPHLAGGATIHYQHDDPESIDGVAKFGSWCRPGEKLEIEKQRG